MPATGSPTLKWSASALADIQRLRAFIETHNPGAASPAAASFKQAANILMTHPGIGKRLEGRQDRELFVPFGQRGYTCGIVSTATIL